MSRRAAAIVIGAAIVLLIVVGAILFFPRGRGSRPDIPFVDERREPRGEIVVAYPDEPLTLNPLTPEGNTSATKDLLRPVLPTLLSISPDLKYRADLATKVPTGKDIGSDPFSVTFTLNKKAKWSDGTPITGNDVLFTWQLIKDSKWPIADRSGYERITEVQVASNEVVKLVFDRPYTAWRDLFSGPGFVLPKHLLEGKDFAAEMSTAVGFSGGPFSIQAFHPGLEVIYVPNPQWWGDTPLLERVTVQFVPDVQTALQLLGRDRVSAVVQTTQINLTNRAKQRGAEVKSAFGAAWWELAFNHSRTPVKDPRWRRGVSTGFDRAGLVEAIIRDEGRALDHLAPGSKVPNSFAFAVHDPGKSKESLRAGGFRESGGFFSFGTVQLSAPAESEIASVIERTIHTGLRNSGIRLEVANPRSQLLYGREWRIGGAYDLAIWERRGTPSLSLLSHYGSNRHPPNGINYYRVGSADLDRVLEAAETFPQLDPNSVATAMNALAETIPAIPLFEAKMFIAFKGLIGPSPNATVEGPFWNLEDWALKG